MFFSFFFVLLVCLETTIRQNNWMIITSVALECVCFSLIVCVSVIPKVLDHSYVQGSFSTMTRHLGNGI